MGNIEGGFSPPSIATSLPAGLRPQPVIVWEKGKDVQEQSNKDSALYLSSSKPRDLSTMVRYLMSWGIQP